MNYFDGVFQQHYLGNTTGGPALFTSGSPILLATSGVPNSLPKGMLGFYLTDSYGQITTAITSGTTKSVTLAMGSWHTIDGIGPNYQGLQVPQYSKTINWNRVKSFIYKKGHTMQNQIVSIGWDQTTSGTTSTVGPLFYCGTDYTLKLEILGDAVLAAYNKEVYNNLQAWGGCCGTACSSGCTSAAVDAAYIMLQWKDRITQNPLLPQFVNPQVFISSGGTKVEVYSAWDNSLNSALPVYIPNTTTPASIIASFQLTVAYVPTTFGTCTFIPDDRFEYSPLWIQASLVNQSFSPCDFNTTINTSVPNMFTELQVPIGSVGAGDFILRANITSYNYRQQYLSTSLVNTMSMRMREIEDDVTIPNISRANTYDQIVLVHNISRPNNPTALHSNDCYMIIIDVISGTDVSALTTLISACLAAVGSEVTLETIA